MKKTIMISLLIIVVINIAFFTRLWGAEAVSKDTESFIKNFLTNENGTLATYIKNAEHLDSDESERKKKLYQNHWGYGCCTQLKRETTLYSKKLIVY